MKMLRVSKILSKYYYYLHSKYSLYHRLLCLSPSLPLSFYIFTPVSTSFYLLISLSVSIFLYVSQKQLPRKMKTRLVIIECAGYTLWQFFSVSLSFSPISVSLSVSISLSLCLCLSFSLSMSPYSGRRM